MSKGRTPRPEPVSIPLWSQDKRQATLETRQAEAVRTSTGLIAFDDE
jgi:hypothetical protein